MPAGYRNAAGVDFDSLFDPYVSGTKPAATGFRDSGGVDLNQRYAPIAVGTKGPNVGHRTSAGLDVSNLWAAHGTASYQGVRAFLAGITANVPIGWIGTPNTQSLFQLLSDGTGRKGNGPTHPVTTFNWTTDGLPPEKAYEVRLINVVVDQGNAAWAFTNNNGGVWVPLDDVNSATICTLKFVPASNAGQGDYEAHGTLQIRERDSGTVVYDQAMLITGEASA